MHCPWATASASTSHPAWAQMAEGTEGNDFLAQRARKIEENRKHLQTLGFSEAAEDLRQAVAAARWAHLTLGPTDVLYVSNLAGRGECCCQLFDPSFAWSRPLWLDGVPLCYWMPSVPARDQLHRKQQGSFAHYYWRDLLNTSSTATPQVGQPYGKCARRGVECARDNWIRFSAMRTMISWTCPFFCRRQLCKPKARPKLSEPYSPTRRSTRWVTTCSIWGSGNSLRLSPHAVLIPLWIMRGQWISTSCRWNSPHRDVSAIGRQAPYETSTIEQDVWGTARCALQMAAF